MAKSSKKVNISPNALKALERLNKSSEELLLIQNDLGKGILFDREKNDKIDNEIDKLATSIYNGFVGVGDNDVSAQEINQILTLSQKIAVNNKQAMKKKIEGFKQSISSSNEALNLIKSKSVSKDVLYKTYGMIIEMIPKMRMSINTIVNGIVSPDDFTKKTFSFTFDNDGSRAEDKKLKINKRINAIIEKNNLSRDILETVEDYLVQGECAWLVTSLNSQIVSLLKESADLPNEGYEKLDNVHLLYESYRETDAEAFSIIQEGLIAFSCGSKEISAEKLLEDVNDFFDDRIVIGEVERLMKDQVDNDESIKKSRFSKKRKTSKKEEANFDGLVLKGDTAIVKRLDTRNLVKLDYDGKVYGYIYLDVIEAKNGFNQVDMQTGSSNPSNASSQPQNSVVNAINAIVYTSNDVSNPEQVKSASINQDPKIKFIADFFVNRLSDKENLNLMKKNENFKDAIYQSLILRRVTKEERLRVTFLSPEEVVHIDRKKSIFDNVLFFCKMYIATLITILMQNIVRGGDKRAYYVEVGLDNDASNAVNSAIRDIKTKDVSNVHNLDLSSMLNILGETSDYFIPTISGEKPISIEDVSGLSNVSLDDDFLNWLSNNIFTGIGIPAAYLTETDNIEFAKALAMQNSRFVRDIVSEQLILGEGYSELLQKIYLKEYGEPSQEEDINKDLKFLDVESIKVSFPPPVTLNITNLNNQLGDLNTLIDAVSEVLDVDQDNLDAAKLVFKREMFRKFLPNVSWEEVDQITLGIKNNIIAQKLKKGKENSMADDSSAGMDDVSSGDDSDPSMTDDT